MANCSYRPGDLYLQRSVNADRPPAPGEACYATIKESHYAVWS
jgi:hypothetical protein